MRESVYRRNNCRLCGGQDFELVLQLTPTPLADSYVPAEKLDTVQQCYPLDLFLCRNCGLSQLLGVVHPEAIYADYIYVTGSSLGLAEHFLSYADEVLQSVNPEKGMLVVDIGSNDGILLKIFQSRGMRVLGIEPAFAIAKRATESGVETLPLFFNAELGHKLKNGYGRATIITSNNLVANIDDLSDMMEGVRALLAPDGVFIFESFYLVDQIQNMVFDFTYHEHLSYFSVKPLEAFFRGNGMELVDVKRIPTKGGSLRYTVQVVGGPRTMSLAVAELMALEESVSIHSTETFRTFAAKIDSTKAQVVSLLRDLKAKEKTIAGYGASATTTTLIYHFGIGDVLSFIVDDFPAKQNLFSPGFHIPVLSPQVLYERKPGYMLILAWRYFEPIMAKHQKYLEQGGHFIVPLPRLEVI